MKRYLRAWLWRAGQALYSDHPSVYPHGMGDELIGAKGPIRAPYEKRYRQQSEE